MKFYPIIFTVILALGLNLPALAQEDAPETQYLLRPLTAIEEFELMSLPVLEMPAGFANRELPGMVDNSTQIYMRPAYQQDGLSCGQASSIGYNFTYEMSRERNLNASLIQNQYPTHFAWNFMNGGSGYYGVSYLHSLQILKEFGMPNVADYGGAMGYGGPSRWMSGYNEYYNSMHNRINNAYQIYVGDAEGLQVLKNWLHNHLEGSDVGGVASFYAQHQSATQMLPYGTPEAGKYVLTSFGGSPNHAMTIVGYNDSIRWDYNNDGQYTNDIDINGDDVVNMKDWEIGGFKMVQSYGGVPNWGNQGFAYMMYKTVADNLGSGGIWNHCVHVLDVKESFEPKLTARVILKHTRRNTIKVFAGLANNVNATQPDIILGFPIYDYQGGQWYMQGGTTEDDKTIEFGFDLSKLLTYVDLGQDVKLFLSVVENDPGNAYAGDLIHFSIYDHTIGGTEIISSQANLPLVNNDTTTMTIVHNFNFNRVEILDETLPAAPVGEYFSHQMTATGGTAPYTWELDKTYTETVQTATFPLITATQLSPSNNSSGKVTQALGFDFPFYDSSFSSITIYVDGYIMFDQQLYPYPYFIDDKVLFNITKNISPFMNQNQEINYSQGCGIWYEGDENSATFRWKTCLSGNSSMQFNYAVKLFPDGNIRFYYGSMNGCANYQWVSGISEGDNVNRQTTAISNKPVVSTNSLYNLFRYNYPPEMEIDENGLFHGTPSQPYGALPITFKVTDNNFIFSTKTLTLSSSGIIVQDSVVSGGDEVIAYNEDAYMNIMLVNIRPDAIYDATMTIHINDPWITLIDSTESLGNLMPGEIERFFDAFSFHVSESVPDNHLIVIETEITSDTSSWESNLFHYAYAPVVSAMEVIVADENERLDPGDTVDIVTSFVNSGGVSVENLYAVLSTEDEYITINQYFGVIPLLEPASSADLIFNVTVSPNCPPGHQVSFALGLTGSNNYTASDTFDLAVGLYHEDFESGDFALFNWGTSGPQPWHIDTYSPAEGSFCAISGSITHSEESVLRIDLEVLSDGEISFFKRVYCEEDTSAANNYDYLSFRVDGDEMARWDGLSEWSRHTFPVSAGFHRFEWVYHKDHNSNYRMDAAWVDDIFLPSAIVVTPELTTNPSALEFTLRPGESEQGTILLSNGAPGSLEFTANPAGIQPSRKSAGSGNRNIEGSYLVTSGHKFHTSKVYTWNYRTYNGGNDNEWIKQMYITFPAGLEITQATDFTGGSGGDMVFQGPMGNGVSAHWFGEDANGWGVVHMGETASCEVTLYTHAGIQEDVMLHYEVMGEVYGGPPHTVTGSHPLRNLGPVTPWMTLSDTAGAISGNQNHSLEITVDATGMQDGIYQAWVLLQDDFGHETTVPVTLTVDQFLGSEEKSPDDKDHSINIYPNPSNGPVTIRVTLADPSKIRAELCNFHGQVVQTLTSSSSVKNHQLSWDGRDYQGNPLPGGAYMVKVTAGQWTGFGRIMIVR